MKYKRAGIPNRKKVGKQGVQAKMEKPQGEAVAGNAGSPTGGASVGDPSITQASPREIGGEGVAGGVQVDVGNGMVWDWLDTYINHVI